MQAEHKESECRAVVVAQLTNRLESSHKAVEKMKTKKKRPGTTHLKKNHKIILL